MEYRGLRPKTTAAFIMVLHFFVRASTIVLVFHVATMNCENAGLIWSQEIVKQEKTDRTFSSIVMSAGGVDRWLHCRAITALDKQAVVRKN
jgi:hypothetical protein